MSYNSKPSRYAVSQSKARVFVGQLEPYVREEDLFLVFSAYGRVLHLNMVRHSTTVTPNEERRIPTAFVWYERTCEADAAIAALHNTFTFSDPDEDEGRKRYVQVSYADKTPEVTRWGWWQKKQAETMRKRVSVGMSSTSSAPDLAALMLHAQRQREVPNAVTKMRPAASMPIFEGDSGDEQPDNFLGQQHIAAL